MYLYTCTYSDFSKLIRKGIPLFKFLKFLHQVSANFWFLNALHKSVFNGDQFVMSVIRYRLASLIEVNDTDSPAQEVKPLNIYFVRYIAYSSKPNKL